MLDPMKEQEDVNGKTVQLVKLLAEVGPDVPEISRRLGQFKESVRYRYKEKILSKGFAVQASADHERLGLKRMILVADFAEAYKAYSQAIFSAMNELAYVVSFAKALVGDQYIVNLSVPTDLIEEVKDFFQILKEKGIFTKLEILDFEWIRTAPMKAEYYDFGTGRWDFEWQNPGPEDAQAASHNPSGATKFDFVDLLIIKELQMDANKTLKEISEKLGINYKKLAWHHTTHVCARGLVRGYSINWMGTRYDYAIEKALHRKHRYFAIDLIVKDVNQFDIMTLRRQIDKLPFLWAEAMGKNYFAALAFPIDYAVEGLQYLGKAMAGLTERATLFAVDQTEAGTFTIPYRLYDEESKRWRFNKESLVRKFEELMVQIKLGGS